MVRLRQKWNDATLNGGGTDDDDGRRRRVSRSRRSNGIRIAGGLLLILMTILNIVHLPGRVRLSVKSPGQSLPPESTTPKPIEPSQLPIFSYNVVQGTKKCVKNTTVIATSSAVRNLNTKHHVRVFPRNGFLLGIVRHGGFLPNEGIDSDLGVISTDIETLNLTVGQRNKVGNFSITPKLNQKNWVNWNGNDPLHNGTQYPFFCVGISTTSFTADAACSFYPYRNNNFFYPRPNIDGFNHAGNAKEMQRWNTEGANFRLVDTDELVTEGNFKKGKQIGTVFSSAFDCMVERQFYFTTILIPCDYEAILLAQYGKNWHRVESRKKWEAVPLSEEESKGILTNGPLPLCA